MNETVVMLLLFAALALGAGVTWLAMRGRTAAHAQRKVELETELVSARAEIGKQQAENLALTSAKAAAEATLESERNNHREKLELLTAAQGVMKDQFAALASDALRNNNASFLQLAKGELDHQQSEARRELENREKAVETLVKPIAESLNKVDVNLRELEAKRAQAYGSLENLVQSVQASQVALTAETGNLVKALRDPQARGRWGELQLRRCLELAGMLEYCDFQEQVTSSGEERTLRPDVVVKLPGDKNLVVDSKVPLEGYSETWNAADEATRAAGLRDHARQVRQHIERLSAKSYWAQFEPTPDFVVLFLPGEVFFRAAMDADPELIEYGVNRKVIVTSPTTLIALMRAVAYGWNQKNLAENARKISEAGKQLYDRLCVMTAHMDNLGRKLDGAVKSYNDTLSSMEKRVFPAGRRIADLDRTLAASNLPDPEQLEKTPRRLESPDWQLESETDPLFLMGEGDSKEG